jgi:hypothetical protein
VVKDKKVRPFNLRDFPDELYWRIKECAARRHMRTKAYVVAALEEATARDSTKVDSAQLGPLPVYSLAKPTAHP